MALILKADFHLHTNEDPQDTYIRYSTKDLIRHAAAQGFEVLSITAHDKIIFNAELTAFAESLGILLIPGVEATVEGYHVLLINYTGPLGFDKVSDLKSVQHPDVLIMAAHPFFPGQTTLKEKLITYIDLFDAIEYCHFYHRFINFNRMALQVSKQYHKPMVGTSDTHFLMQMGHTYSEVQVDQKTARDVVHAIKAGRVKVVSRPLSVTKILRVLASFRSKLFKTGSKK